MAESRRRRRSSVSESELSDDEKESTAEASPRKPRDSECESEAGTEEVSEYESYQEGDYETEEETEETEYEEESIVIEEGEEGDYIEEERQSGDGEEQPDGTGENLDDDEDAKNPQYIPRKGAFYEHDNRLSEEELEKQMEAEKKGEKKLWKDDGKWLHDRYRQDLQGPKTREELITMYGFDIRDAEHPPEGPRFSRRMSRGKRGSHQLRDFIDGRKEFQDGPREYRPRSNRDNRDNRDRGEYRGGGGEYRGRGGEYRGGGGGGGGDYRGEYKEDFRESPRDYRPRDRGDGDRGGMKRRGKPRQPGYPGTAEIVVIEDRRTEEEKMYEEGYGREFRGREFSRGAPRGRGTRGGQRGGTGRVGPPQRKTYSDMRRNQRSASPPFSRPSPPPQPKMAPQQKQEIQSAVYEKRSERPEDLERDEREATPTNNQGDSGPQQEKKSYQRDRRANTKDKGAPPAHGDHGNYENDYPKGQRPDSNQNTQRNYNNYNTNQGGNKSSYAPANIPPRLQNQAQNHNQGGGKGSSSADLGQNRPKRYSSQRQRPPNEGTAAEPVGQSQMQRPQGQYYPPESEGIKFSANAPVFKPRGQQPQMYPPHNTMPAGERPGGPRGGGPRQAGPRPGPRPMPPPMPGGVTTPAHSMATFPPQTSFAPQQRVPFSLPPTSAIQSPPRMFSPTVTATIPATGVTMATAGGIVQPATFITAPPIMSYPGGPPPPHPPPPHGPMAGPPPPPHGFQMPPATHVPIQNYPNTNPPNEVGVRIKGGTTYFNPELQQQHSPSRSPVRRPKAAIPIVNPEDLKAADEQEEYIQIMESDDGQSEVALQSGEYMPQEGQYMEYYDDPNYVETEQSYEQIEPENPSVETVESVNQENVTEHNQDVAETSQNVAKRLQGDAQVADDVKEVAEQVTKQVAEQVSEEEIVKGLNTLSVDDIEEKSECLKVAQDTKETDRVKDEAETKSPGSPQKEVDANIAEVVVTKPEESEQFSEALSEVQDKNETMATVDSNTLSPKCCAESADALSTHSDESFHDTQETPEVEAVTDSKDVTASKDDVTSSKDVTALKNDVTASKDVSDSNLVEKKVEDVSTESIEKVEKEQSAS